MSRFDLQFFFSFHFVLKSFGVCVFIMVPGFFYLLDFLFSHVAVVKHSEG